LHGFINQLKFELGELSIQPENASVTCHTSYNGELDYYPFPFTAQIKYTLDKNTGFNLQFSITNSGNSNMPVGLGWHPYFRLTENVSSTVLRLPKLKMVEIDKFMIPTGKMNSFTAFDTPHEIKDFVLDNCFMLDQNNDVAIVTLEGIDSKLIYSQNTDIPYLQIFTPPHRKSIALEPMTCNVDAFNNGNGLRVLPVKETISLECNLSLEIRDI